ncbi:hypothetical protein L7F22_028914 [Adiantum nelumboides]|nr:hypothetical protein [Adiantum nelumboides]
MTVADWKKAWDDARDTTTTRLQGMKGVNAFYALPYWGELLINHLLDPMHCFKNVAVAIWQHICGQKDNHNSRADLKDADVMRRILDDNDDDTSEERGLFLDEELEYSSTSTDGSPSESENSFLNAFELDTNTDEIDTFSHSSIGLNLEIVLEIDHEDLYADITSVS